MSCDQVVKLKCQAGHIQSFFCHKGKPASCRTCENEKKAKEKKTQDELARQQKRELEQQRHNERIAKIEEEIRQIKEAAADDQERTEMAQALDQKKRDLVNAKRFKNHALSSSINEDAIPYVTAHSDTTHSKAQANLQSPKSDVGSTATQSQDKLEPSPSEIEWERQKRVENASNDAIDSLIKMTGLEDVKLQVLKIKARVDTALRQNTNMKDERYGVVLLGNPGTGKI